MNYLLLIYTNEAELMGLGETALQKVSGEYVDFTKSIVRSTEARVLGFNGARAQR